MLQVTLFVGRDSQLPSSAMGRRAPNVPQRAHSDAAFSATKAGIPITHPQAPELDLA